MQHAWLRPLPLVAILRGLPAEDALEVGTALVEAGFHILEVPLNSPQPFASIDRLARAFGEQCLVGAGTVMTPDDVDRVASAGGRLIVMPHTDATVIGAAKQKGLHCIPGAATPSEAFAALRAGADAIKVFPAEQITPAVLHAWRAVLPRDTEILPVGGIAPDTMAAYCHAGATGFGIGSALYKPGRSINDIADTARRFVRAWNSITTCEPPP